VNKSFHRFEELAREHRLTPRFLREIAYYGALGYKHNQIVEQTGISGTTVSKYRKKLRNMDDEEAEEIFRLVAEIKAL
jgi:DNA-binding NarL/FixJ family response regulator